MSSSSDKDKENEQQLMNNAGVSQQIAYACLQMGKKGASESGPGFVYIKMDKNEEKNTIQYIPLERAPGIFPQVFVDRLGQRIQNEFPGKIYHVLKPVNKDILHVYCTSNSKTA